MRTRIASLFARPVVLAALGWGLVGGTFLAASAGFFGGHRAWSVVAAVLFGLACASHLAAFAADLWTTRTRRRVPVVALHYAAVIAGIGLWRLTAAQREAAGYREDPQRMSVEVEGDALAVRTSAGVWRVPLGACAGGPAPGVTHDTTGAGIGTRSHDGVVEVSFAAAARPYMRLAVSERRITCVR